MRKNACWISEGSSQVLFVNFTKFGYFLSNNFTVHIWMAAYILTSISLQLLLNIVPTTIVKKIKENFYDLTIFAITLVIYASLRKFHIYQS